MKAKTKIDGFHLLKKNEWKELLGGKKLNIVFLIFVFSLSILSISISSARLSYLEYKMKDRYVNCIDIIVDQVSGDKNELRTFLNDIDKESLGIENTEPVYLIGGNFYNSSNDIVELAGRSCSDSCLLYTCVLSDKNVVGEKRCILPLSNRDISLIVSIGGLKKLGLDTTVVFLDQCEMFYVDSAMKLDSDTTVISDFENVVYRSFSIPIYAIVKELPDMRDFLVPEAYIRQKLIRTAIRKTDDVEKMIPFNVTDSNINKSMYVCVPDSIKDGLVERIKYDGLSVNDEKYEKSYSNGYSKLIVNSQQDNYMKLYDSLFVVYSSCFNGIKRVYDFRFPEYEMYEIKRDPNLYSCFFNSDSLCNVEKFRDLLKSEVNYNIDMNKIYSMNNLNIVQVMVKLLSSLIIIISISFLCGFIILLLQSHFQKIQMNLGTFKAFGISNGVLVGIYVRLMFKMTLLAFAVSFLLLVIITSTCALFSSIEQGYPYFNVWAWQNFLLLGLAIVASIVTTWAVSYGLLKHTPGDLIYDRVGKKSKQINSKLCIDTDQ